MILTQLTINFVMDDLLATLERLRRQRESRLVSDGQYREDILTALEKAKSELH